MILLINIPSFPAKHNTPLDNNKTALEQRTPRLFLFELPVFLL